MHGRLAFPSNGKSTLQSMESTVFAFDDSVTHIDYLENEEKRTSRGARRACCYRILSVPLQLAHTTDPGMWTLTEQHSSRRPGPCNCSHMCTIQKIACYHLPSNLQRTTAVQACAGLYISRVIPFLAGPSTKLQPVTGVSNESTQRTERSTTHGS